jgi:flagellar protein FliO/FliZ
MSSVRLNVYASLNKEAFKMFYPCQAARFVIVTACMLFSGMVVAVEQGEAAVATSSVTNSVTNNPVNASYLAQLVVGLLVVILCIIALAWFAKRFGRLQSSPDGALQMLGGMSMGARERIVLVQVGDKQLLLGVAPGSINTLHVLDEPVHTSAPRTSNMTGGSFAEKLGAMLSQGKS